MSELDEHDLRVDVFTNAVPFDQHREETWPTVRVTHLPTGRVVSRTDPSQRRARDAAVEALRTEEIR